MGASQSPTSRHVGPATVPFRPIIDRRSMHLPHQVRSQRRLLYSALLGRTEKTPSDLIGGMATTTSGAKWRSPTAPHPSRAMDDATKKPSQASAMG
jgi:hypothetical protein